ncbi:MAG: hypothetical protein JSR77_10410 [Planctomycetes bacterium]|nr:hypothetical protein [Planctomycetota bacterium]
MITRPRVRAGFSALLLASLARADVSTAFTYQGELTQFGAPVDGQYDLRFRLLDSASGGNPIGAEQCADNVTVTGGKFSVLLDFGAQFSGPARFLMVRVRSDAGAGCADSSGFTDLTPAQEITAAPKASFAASATTASTATNALSIGGQPASNVALLSGNQTFTGALNFSNASNVFSGTFTGNGSQLTALNGANISAGTITRSRVGSDIESVLSQWTTDPGHPAGVNPLDAVMWETNTIPVPPPGTHYTQLTGGNTHSIALLSDGTVVAWGDNSNGQLNVPALPPGVTYTGVGAGFAHSIALRSNGTAVAWGWNGLGQCNVPALPPGVTYTFVEAGERHSVALRSDGTAVAWGQGTVVNAGFGNFGQCIIPPLPPGMTYTKVAAGNFTTMLARSDGQCFVFGWNSNNQATLPPLPPGAFCTDVAAGGRHSVALFSDGTIIAWGDPAGGKTTVPALPPGVVYTKIATGNDFTMALRSDGNIVVWGAVPTTLLTPPPLDSGTVYTDIGAGYGNCFGLRGVPVEMRPPSLSSGIGVSIGTSVPPPTGGLRVTGSAIIDGNVTAALFAGDGSALTNLNASNIVGTLPAASLPGTFARTDATNEFGAFNNSFAGHVGIGTTSPANPLHIVADNYGFQHTSADGTSDVTTYVDATAGWIGTVNNKPLFFYTNNSYDIAMLSTAGQFGVGTTTPQARLDSRATNANETAVRGLNTAGGINIGVNGEVVTGYGVYGKATNTTGSNYGVYGQTLSTAANAFGVYSNGRLGASGTKAFVIDHPLDPANKVLMHYCAEGPEPQNVYNGIVTLDDAGTAVITLPAYFSSINVDPRYQLTPIGGPALLYVASEIQDDRFSIAGGKPGMKVSWEVKARRNDAFVRRYGAPVEVDKPANEKGSFIRPDLYDAVTSDR